MAQQYASKFYSSIAWKACHDSYKKKAGEKSGNTSWSNNCQSNHLSNASLTANQKLSVYARGRTGSSYTFVPMLVIIES